MATHTKRLPAGTEAPAQAPKTTRAEHTEDFFSAYANNIKLESTVYDLRLVFGETDLSSGTEITKQHTAITLPWPLVKVALYYLQVNLAVHELTVGKVIVPPTQIPVPASEVPPAMANDPMAHKVKDLVAKTRQKFLDSL
jgi:hypothetical protein